MPATSSQSSRTGATLIEVIVALGIGVLIVTVIILSHHSLTQLAGRQMGQQRINESADHTINELRRDLQELFLPVDDPNGAVLLEQSATNLTTLSFCRWAATTGDSLMDTQRLERVTYRFEQFNGKTELIRTIKALVGPDSEKPESTNRLDHPWPRISVHLYDGESWQTNWPTAAGPDDKRDPPRPRAARIQLLPEAVNEKNGSDPVYETMLIIPSGLSVTSTVLRTIR